jgi:NAD dependent epimerase/dehydratase family enzyme
MAWVSLDDAVGAILLALRDGAVRGPVNVVAPNPVTNAQFTGALGQALGRPTLLAVPAFALKALFGEMAEGTVLASQRVLPKRLTELGYTFRHPDISTALQAALAETPG